MFEDAQVYELSAQVVAVGVIADGAVVAVGHEQAQPEAVKLPFDSALPVFFFFAHLQQFSGERKLFGGQLQRIEDTGAELHVVLRNLGRAFAQGL